MNNFAITFLHVIRSPSFIKNVGIRSSSQQSFLYTVSNSFFVDFLFCISLLYPSSYPFFITYQVFCHFISNLSITQVILIICFFCTSVYSIPFLRELLPSSFYKQLKLNFSSHLPNWAQWHPNFLLCLSEEINHYIYIHCVVYRDPLTKS